MSVKMSLEKDNFFDIVPHVYWPTIHDKIQLGDTDLFAEIERDFAVYGDECAFEGGIVLRDGMGQASGHLSSNYLETVITNVMIIDYTGIYKADIGIKEGCICNNGKAGNRDVMDGVAPNYDCWGKFLATMPQLLLLGMSVALVFLNFRSTLRLLLEKE